MSNTLSKRHPNRQSRFAPIAFAVVGAASRFEFPLVETRIHIIWFWVAALWFQFIVQCVSRVRVSLSLLLLNGAAATFGILLTKFALEGFPHHAAKALIGLF
jgi:hypothetical protein